MKKLISLFIGIVMLMGMGVAQADTTHMIKYRDTLTAIAKTYNTTIEALLKLNTQIKHRNRIYAGHTITISRNAEKIAVAQPREIPKLSAVSKPKLEVQNTKTLNSCDPVAAIEKLHYPANIAEQLKVSVSKSLEASLTGTQDQAEHMFTVTNKDSNEYFAFSYTNNCTYAKYEGIQPYTTLTKETAQTGPPLAIVMPDKPIEVNGTDASRLRINGQGEAQTTIQQIDTRPQAAVTQSAEQFVENELKEISEELIRILGPSKDIPEIALQILTDRYTKKSL